MRVWLRVGKRKEQAFKSLLGKSGYSEKVSDEIWKWYTAPTRGNKNSDNWLEESFDEVRIELLAYCSIFCFYTPITFQNVSPQARRRGIDARWKFQMKFSWSWTAFSGTTDWNWKIFYLGKTILGGGFADGCRENAWDHRDESLVSKKERW